MLDTPTHHGQNGQTRLEARISEVGTELGAALNLVLDALDEGRRGPQILARALGLDKVLTSRLLKAARSRDPMAVVYHAPGPEPLRRFVRAARKGGADGALANRAQAAVADFESLIREDVGDRSALDAMIAAWLPEAREVFELRRRQSAFKALSQLKGVSADVTVGTVLLNPSSDGKHLDVLWVVGLLGVQRLRAGATVKLSSRRMPGEELERQPRTLTGRPVEDLEGLRLDQFCAAPPAPVEVRRVRDTVQYLLAGDGFGPGSAVDLILAEVNESEMARFVDRKSDRKGYVFAEVGTPCHTLLFDVLVHEEVWPRAAPELVVYDTVLEGVASVNDPLRDIDRMDIGGVFQYLGKGADGLRTPDVPHYSDLVRHVFDSTGWDAGSFRAYRFRRDYPLYGSQVTAVFQPPEL